ERRRAVAIGVVLLDFRQLRDAELDELLRRAVGRLARRNFIVEAREHLAHEHGDDRGRRLVGAEPVFVSRRRDPRANEPGVRVHRLEHGREEHEEAEILVRRLPRLEQVHAIELVVRVNGERPVAVLARAVDAGEWLLVQYRLQAVPQRDLAQGGHDELVVVHRDVGLLEHRRHLELARRHLVVSRDDGDAELVQLVFHFGDAGLNAFGDAAKVVIFELLPARWRCADQRAAAHDEIRTQREVAAIDQEVFLLGAQRGVHAVDALVAQQLEHLDGLVGQHIGAAEQRRLLVERFAIVANEDRRNAQRARARGLDDEDGARRIPRRVAARFPGGAQAAGREAGRIGLALNELFGGERLHGLEVVVEREECVVLFGGESGLRLEPVREVGDAARDGPLLDHLRDGGRDILVELLAVANGGREPGIDITRQLGAHLARAERIDTKVFGRGVRSGAIGGAVERGGGRRGAALRDFPERGFPGGKTWGGHGVDTPNVRDGVWAVG